MTTQHTPTPYRIGLKPGPMLYAQDGEQIADCTFENGGNNKANAEFIVRACNAHDELVSVGQQIRLALHSGADLSELFECRCDDKENGHVCIGHQLEKALAKAKGDE